MSTWFLRANRISKLDQTVAGWLKSLNFLFPIESTKYLLEMKLKDTVIGSHFSKSIDKLNSSEHYFDWVNPPPYYWTVRAIEATGSNWFSAAVHFVFYPNRPSSPSITLATRNRSGKWRGSDWSAAQCAWYRSTRISGILGIHGIDVSKRIKPL